MISDLTEKVQDAEKILAYMPDIVIITDNEGHWLRVNPAFERITGFGIEEVIGKKTLEQPVYKDLPEGIELNKQMWERIYKGEIVTDLEIPWKTKSGRKIYLSASEQWLKDAKGKVIGRVFTARDVTELHKRKEKLKKTRKQ
jgi:two-component system sporulation sensor kinase A